MKLTPGTLQRILLDGNKAPFLFCSILFSFFFSFQALASPKSLTYQGRILKADGTPLDYGNVSFIFQITNPSGSCVIYQEQVNAYSFVNSGGVFDVPIGEGTVQYPLVTTSILDVFNNSGSFTCGSCSLVNGNYTCSNGSSTYAASVGDTRKLRVSFYDGSGWKTITPDNTIRSVPFAGYALAAEKIGTHVASDFLLKAGLPTCTAGTFFSYDGTSLTCTAVSGSNGGTVTNVTSANSYLTVNNNTSTPTLTVNVGSVANTVAAGNDPRIVNALQSGSSASGDLSGTYPGPTVIALQGVGVSATTPTLGQVLKFNGTNWGGATLGIPDISGLSASLSSYLTQSAFNGYVASAGCSTSQTMYWNSVSGNFQCQAINLAIAGDVSGSIGAVSVDKIKGKSISSTAPTSAQFLVYDGTTQYAPVSMSGDATMSASGVVTVTASALTNAKMADMAANTLKGNITGAAAPPTDITIASLQGATSSTFAAGNDSRITGALQTSGGTMTGMLALATGTTTLSPLRIPSGTLVTTPVSGNIESDGSSLYWTNNTPTRQKLASYEGAAANGQLLIGNGTDFSLANLTQGSGITITNSAGGITISATGSGGTVTSVSSANTDITVADSTSTPQLTLNSGSTGGAGDANKIAKLDLNGLLAINMIPNHDTAKLTSGTLPVARGGTNSSAALTNNRIMASSGGAIVEAAAITASKALVSDANGIPTHSSVTSTELGYLSGVTSAVQTQINGKASSTGWTNYSVIGTDSSGALTAIPGVTANTMLQYTLTGPVWSSATYPDTTTVNQLLYSSATNVVSGLATSNNAILTTNGTGVPGWSTLSNDSFTQYALLAGRAGGQTLNGGTAASDNLTLDSTSNGTKGNILINPTGGNVGIGTTWPSSSKLTVVGSSSGTAISTASTIIESIFNSDTTSNNWTQLGFGDAGHWGGSVGVQMTDHTNGYGDFTIATNSASGYTEKLRVLSTGSVGIGTANPATLGDGENTKVLQVHEVGGQGVTSLTTDRTTSGAFVGTLSFGTTGTTGVDKRSALISSTLTAASGANVTGDMRFYTSNGGTVAQRMTIDATGNVGIGTTSPISLLHLKLNVNDNSGTYTQGVLLETNSNKAAGVWADQKSGGFGELVIGTNGTGPAGTPTERVRIDRNGNVGIGTTNPARILDVSTSTTNAARIRITGANTTASHYSGLEFYGGAAGTTWGGGLLREQSTNDISIWSASNGAAPRVTIQNSTGNVGIGTLAPNAKLDVDGGASTAVRGSSTGSYAVIGTSTNTHGVYGSTGVWGGVGVYGYNASTGATGYLGYTNVGGNFTSPSGAGGNGSNSTGDVGLYAGNYAGFYTYLATGNWGASSNGNANFNDYYDQASGVWLSSYSDRRLKRSIKNLPNAFGLEAILKLRPVTYHWKDKEQDATEGEKVGFIAQEVQKVIPDLVLDGKKDKTIETENGTEKIEKPKSFFAQYLTAPIVKAIQEFYAKWMEDSRNLHAQINQLEIINATNEKEIAELKAELFKQRKDFETRLNRLENSLRAPAENSR